MIIYNNIVRRSTHFLIFKKIERNSINYIRKEILCHVILDFAQCPYCSKKQSQKPVKSWKYGKAIVPHTSKEAKWGKPITCYRYNCVCGKFFNFYDSVKGKSWTIPKK